MNPFLEHLAATIRTAGLAALLIAACALPASGATVTVFAAASTASAVTEVADLFAARGLGHATASFAASSTLAKQIARGAPADIFISADPGWMDYLDGESAIEASSRLDLLANRLVLIAPADSPLAIDIGPAFPLAEKLGGGMLAMGDPDHVPAGIYGRTALIRLGVWRGLAGRVARTQDVRAALALVERGEVAVGLVYATDAEISDRVRVVATFPAASHPPITYPAAIVAGRDRPEVRRFLDFMTSAEAVGIFTRHGFTMAPAAAR